MSNFSQIRRFLLNFNDFPQRGGLVCADDGQAVRVVCWAIVYLDSVEVPGGHACIDGSELRRGCVWGGGG